MARPRIHFGPTSGIHVSHIPVDLLAQFKLSCMVNNIPMVTQMKKLMQEYVDRPSVKAAVLKRTKELAEL